MKRFGIYTAALGVAALMVSPVQAASGLAKIAGTAPDSRVAGEVMVTDSPKGLRLEGRVTGLTPGQHAFHIHEFGACGDSGKAAGSHYNPMNHPHGNVVKDGQSKAHAGDMGNLEADAQGTAKIDVTIPGLNLSGGKLNAAGRALVVHEKHDDFGQPVGNAGGRVGCGPILVTGN